MGRGRRQRRQLRVAERHERTGDTGQHEGHDPGGSRIQGGRRACQDENAGADDGADAERGVGGAKGAAAKGTARGEWPLFSGGARGLGSGRGCTALLLLPVASAAPFATHSRLCPVFQCVA